MSNRCKYSKPLRDLIDAMDAAEDHFGSVRDLMMTVSEYSYRKTNKMDWLDLAQEIQSDVVDALPAVKSLAQAFDTSQTVKDAAEKCFKLEAEISTQTVVLLARGKKVKRKSVDELWDRINAFADALRELAPAAKLSLRKQAKALSYRARLKARS